MFKTIFMLISCISLSNQLILPDINYKLEDTKYENIEIHDNVVQYIPLGWTGNLYCPSVNKAQLLGIQDRFVVWKYTRQGNEVEEEQDVEDPYSLGEVKSVDDNMIIRCSLKNYTHVATNIRLVLQNCVSPIKEDSYNLYDPCQYGKCTVKDEKLACLCFKQYTGAYCNIAKDYGFIHTILPFFLPILFLVAAGQLVLCFRKSAKSKSRKQMMQINRHAVPIDKQLIKHYNLFRADYYMSSKKASSSKASQSDGTEKSGPQKIPQQPPKKSMRTPLPKYEKSDVEKIEIKKIKSKDKSLEHRKKTEKTQSSRKRTEKHKKEKTKSRERKTKREKTTSRKKMKESTMKIGDAEKREEKEKEVESTQHASNNEHDLNFKI